VVAAGATLQKPELSGAQSRFDAIASSHSASTLASTCSSSARSGSLVRSGELRVAVRKEVCRSIVKQPFCIHPVMQVFADLRPSLVLVVHLSTVVERRGRACLLERAEVEPEHDEPELHAWIAWRNERLAASVGLTAQIRPEERRANLRRWLPFVQGAQPSAARHSATRGYVATGRDQLKRRSGTATSAPRIAGALVAQSPDGAEGMGVESSMSCRASTDWNTARASRALTRNENPLTVTL
jgi:hypothetical protein